MFSRWRDVWRKLRGDGTKARTQFADARWSRTSTPCPGVWMRVPLVYGLVLTGLKGATKYALSVPISLLVLGETSASTGT
eukprot:scaffold157073_cov24-Tisochrysis_lutea.AAC.1